MRSTLRRRVARALRVLAWGVIALVLALALGVLMPASPTGARQAPGEGGGRHEILVLSGLIHTDLALPATPDIRRRFAFLSQAGLPVEDPRVVFVVAGRGGRAFYLETPTWGDLRPGPVIRSFGSDDAVLRLGLSGPLDAETSVARIVTLDDAGLDALADFVLAGLARAGGAPILVDAPGYGALDRFFEAEGRFNALLGCNVWTARALNTVGVRTGAWTPLPALLLASLDLHG